MQKKYKRLIFYTLFIVLFLTGGFILSFVFYEQMIYFYLPHEAIQKANTIQNKKIRIGGLVKTGSYDPDQKIFYLYDKDNKIKVIYQTTLPDLFREEQGIIAQGTLEIDDKNEPYVRADLVLAKHDEVYIPKDVYDKIKQEHNPKKSDIK